MTPTRKDAAKLLLDGSVVLSQMEANGIRVDVPYLEKTLADVTSQIASNEAKLRSDEVWKVWKTTYRDVANLGSREQLGDIIFGKLGHRCRKYTEKSYNPDGSLTDNPRPATDESNFSDIDLPFVKTYFETEKLKKLKGTYLEGVRKELVGELIRPFINLHLVTTYRSSYDSINWQNQPSRNPAIAKLIRRCYIPRPGCRIVEIDFSGIEVRVAACYNQDPVLIKYIKDPTTDMHRDMAAELFCLPLEMLKENAAWAKKTVRDWSKNRFVFPEFYGSVFFQCAPNLWDGVVRVNPEVPGTGLSLRKWLTRQGINRGLGIKVSHHEGADKGRIETEPGTFIEHVRKVEESFWKVRFKVYDRWRRDWYAAYQRTGGFDTLTGFRIDGFLKRNDVNNWGIQGSAFHCLLWSIIRIQKLLNKRKMKSLLIGEIHDSLIADVPEEEIQGYINLAVQTMTVRLPAAWKWIIVPIEVAVEVTALGGSWADKSVWVKRDGKWAPRSV